MTQTLKFSLSKQDPKYWEHVVFAICSRQKKGADHIPKDLTLTHICLMKCGGFYMALFYKERDNTLMTYQTERQMEQYWVAFVSQYFSSFPFILCHDEECRDQYIGTWQSDERITIIKQWPLLPHD